MNNNNLDSAVEELRQISEELSSLKRIREALADDLVDVKESVDESKKTIADSKKTLEEIKELSKTVETFSKSMEQFAERIERVNAAFSRNLEDAKQIENRLIMEKMELLISKAEILGRTNTSNIAKDKKTASKNNVKNAPKKTETKKLEQET